MTAHEQPPFHERLKKSTWTEHQRTATSPYVRELLHGRVSRHDYAQLVIAHHFAYTVLEKAAREHAADPIVGRFVRTELYRVDAIEADLAELLGPGWREEMEATPAIKAYAAHLEVACADPVAFVAHHYVRYLGDLSGGQIIARRLAPVYQGAGLNFYAFGEIADIDGFKSGYRELLDTLPLGADGQAALIAEATVAYRFNGDIFDELTRRLGLGEQNDRDSRPE